MAEPMKDDGEGKVKGGKLKGGDKGVASPFAVPAAVTKHQNKLADKGAAAAAAGAGAAASATGSAAAQADKTGAVAVAALIDDLRNTDMAVRLNAFHKLDVIARALGHARTRDELVPYLNEFIDEDDEVLVVLSEELGKLVEYVGGGAHAHVLLVPLETLAGVEESSVREKVVESISAIVRAMNGESVVKFVVPMLRRLANADWFTSRISACGLFAVSYPRVDDTLKKLLRSLYTALCADETPMVRRAACLHFAKFTPVVEYKEVKAELLPAFLKLAKDDQDSVRLLTVDACVTLATLFKHNGAGRQLLPVVLGLCADKSWRVRYMVADKFCLLCEAVTEQGSDAKEQEQLVDGFVRLLQDNEAEVRTASSAKVGEAATLFGADVTLRKLLTPTASLVKDQSQYTRAALASVITSLALVLKKQDVLSHCLPLFLTLLKDQNPEVRLNIIAKLESVHSVIGVELLSQSLLPAICELALDKKWRVRLAIINHIPSLAKQMGQQFFDAKLNDLCMGWLGDPVFSIRQAATANLTKLVEVFGTKWSQQTILPKVISLCSHKSYLFRMTSLFAFNDLGRVLGPQLTTDMVLPVLLKMSGDTVPNVRFNVAKTLTNVLDHITVDAITKHVLPGLNKLTADPDADVKHYATLALEAIAKKLAKRP